MARTATGIDVGTSAVKALRGEVKGTSFVVTGFAYAPNPGGTVESGWQALTADFKPSSARVGLTGREVNVRYSRVPRVPDWQLRRLMRFEAEEVGGQSEASVASDYNVLPEIPEIEGEDVVMLCMARESLLETHLQGLAGVRGKLDAFTPNAVALYNAFLHYGVVMDDTVLVANIGRDSTDVIVVRGSDLLFARNLSGGSKLFDEAISDRFGVSADKAETYKQREGTLSTRTGFKDPNQEKASRALMGPAGQILSLLQSTVLFCKSQAKLSSLKLDRVLLCGGGARLSGLSEYLSSAMSVPVEPFDPFVVVDASKLDPDASALLEEHRLSAVVALGLATSASDPDAYAIEVLPERIRKRREIARGPAFLVAAAVLALVYLGLSVWHKRGTLADLERQADALDSRHRRALRVDQETRSLVEENRELAAYADELFALAGSGEQLVLALDAIDRSLPADFWLETMTSAWASDEELGVPRAEERPILRLRGRTREGTDAPAALFEEFVAALRRELAAARIKERMGDTAAFFTLDLTMLARPDEPGDPGGDGAAEEEG